MKMIKEYQEIKCLVNGKIEIARVYGYIKTVEKDWAKIALVKQIHLLDTILNKCDPRPF